MDAKRIIYWLALLAGINFIGNTKCNADSASDIFLASQDALLKASSLRVEYTSQVKNGEETITNLQGMLFLKQDNSLFFTNNGTFLLQFNFALVSDGKDFLCVRLFDDQIHPPFKLAVWDRDRGNPFPERKCVSRLLQEGITSLLVAFTHDFFEVTEPLRHRGIFPYSTSITEVCQITNVRLLDDELVAGIASHHLSYTIDRGTNGVEPIDLWVDHQSLLPVKRVSVPRVSGFSPSSKLVETYSFVLNPKLDPTRFDPKQVIRKEKLESQVAKEEEPSTELIKASLRGDLTSAIKALKRGANPNVRTSSKVYPPPDFTPIMLAAMEGHLNIVEVLVDAKADVNAIGWAGGTPLQLATKQSHPDVAKYLKEHGAK